MQSQFDKFADLYRVLFGRTLSHSESKSFGDEVRAACQPKWDELSAALRVIADRNVDSNGHAPTSPAVIREIRLMRASGKAQAGGESFEDAIRAIGSEPDENVRWSMICTRGASDALLAMLARNGIKYARWDSKNEWWPWRVLLLDPEFKQAARELQQRSESSAPPNETGAERQKRKDRHSVAFQKLFTDTARKRAAENWQPPELVAPGPNATVTERVAFILQKSLMEGAA